MHCSTISTTSLSTGKTESTVNLDENEITPVKRNREGTVRAIKNDRGSKHHGYYMRERTSLVRESTPTGEHQKDRDRYVDIESCHKSMLVCTADTQELVARRGERLNYPNLKVLRMLPQKDLFKDHLI